MRLWQTSVNSEFSLRWGKIERAYDECVVMVPEEHWVGYSYAVSRAQQRGVKSEKERRHLLYYLKQTIR
jgi:hypothetical protein